MADLDDFEFVPLEADVEDGAEDITDNVYKQEIDYSELVWSEEIKKESEDNVYLGSTSTTKLGGKVFP